MPRCIARLVLLSSLLVPWVARGGPLRQVAEDPAAGFVEDSPPMAGRFTFNLGVGLVFPVGESHSRFKAGWGFLLGGGYHFTEHFGLRAEYQYSDYNLKSDVLPDERVSGDHIMQYGDLNLFLGLLSGRRLGLYVTAGPGLYYRKVELTQFAGTGLVPVCDPYFFTCYTEVVPVDVILDSRSSTDIGVNGGVGLTYRLYGTVRVYLEARYHHIFGPEYQTATGARRANGQYLPINLGLRF
ncbi:outer membrane beta-barrel protein [Myxococcus sp. MISCRS1]|jgi:opacity protein-like surface antigen|uniref:outer membrane beta-barrel protein n=1 Tax=Myxococcus TaxID=32 RepID=UPI001CBD3727|nr:MULTISPECIES: outer membrane beta-barrel protein [unclassified Myxococcus]MBZ4397558.1 porin family protein [Myxococcus sp. AS-1-15]MBZ4411188.1 porin family protein [Myxococcus sp. XM-1-1-1]MCY1003592.1 outer membrane beta-barrel protein [Myxococcus sp. MISCRS1]BDT34800.1 outer membrane beta-barrel protein [Myxococcus sp. MH1]